MGNLTDLEYEFVLKQKEVCKKYKAEYLASPFSKLVGVSVETFSDFNMPINGFRHPIQAKHSANWYIWAGEQYSVADDFFKPMHISHLLELCPKVIKYLGLAPGWRFLFDNEYEDVWYDEGLLKV